METYGTERLFDILIRCVRWMTVAFGAATLILVVIARRVEPKGAAIPLKQMSAFPRCGPSEQKKITNMTDS
jgi:hypothetical protein